jgi:GNAT superfamily N-acetyltransferase
MSDIVTDVSPSSLAQANETNLAEGFAALTRACGGEVCDEPDLLWYSWGIPVALANGVLRAQLAPDQVDARIAWALQQARTLHVPFFWRVGPSMRPLGLGERLLQHGLTAVGDVPAMGVALARLPPALSMPEGVTVERVRDRAGLECWTRTVVAGFGMPPDAGEALLMVLSRNDLLGDTAPVHFYLASLQGEPVAGSTVLVAAGVAGIFNVATLEAARGRGIGTAITLAPLLDARDHGYRIGVLQASEMGYSIYAQMGFTEQFRYHLYHWEPA